jgi:hypothetical protein
VMYMAQDLFMCSVTTASVSPRLTLQECVHTEKPHLGARSPECCSNFGREMAAHSRAHLFGWVGEVRFVVGVAVVTAHCKKFPSVVAGSSSNVYTWT